MYRVEKYPNRESKISVHRWRLFFFRSDNKEHLASFDLQVHQLLRDQVQPDGAHPRPVGSETPRADRGDRPSEPSSSDGQNGRGHDSRGTAGPVALNERNLVAISWRFLWWVKRNERVEWNETNEKWWTRIRGCFGAENKSPLRFDGLIETLP